MADAPPAGRLVEARPRAAAAPVRPSAPAPLPAARLAFLVPAGLALLTGLDAGLIRLGLPAPVRASRLPDVHGLVMVLGFVGTLVALERAIALGRAWGYVAPGGLAAGAVLLVGPVPRAAAAAVLVAGSAALLALYLPLWRRQAADAVLAQALGAALALGACLLWAGGVPVPALLPWLAGFLVLTIAGERLELARLSLSAGRERAVLATCAATTVAVPCALLWPAAGTALLGVAVLALAGGLVVCDVARRTVRGRGLPRFAAVCLLAGYGWLGVAGTSWLLAGPVTEGPGYDAVVHAVFLGFVMSMIMAHAPVILPAVLRRPLPYRPAMYVPVALLHATLALRVGVGDAHGLTWAWQLGGVGNVVAVLTFLGVAARSSLAGPR